MIKLALLQLGLAAASATAASEADYSAVKDGKLGFISMPLTRRENKRPSLRARDNDVPLYNQTSVSYLIELNIGTPEQTVKVAIDTGSDELWVNPDCTTSGSVDLEQDCYEHGQYDPNDSSTSTVTSVENYIPYGKGEVQMQYVLDNITLSDSTLEISQQIFGVAVASSELNEGILGLSYGMDVNLDYPNFVDMLYLQNQTNTRAFSIALGSKDTNIGGTLIFGGVDTKKFTGDLKSADILGPQNGEQLARYWVNLTGVAFTNDGDSSAYDMNTVPVVLDSGSTLSYLPEAIVADMATDLDGEWDRTNELYIVPCDTAEKTDTMDFSFGNDITIRVPMYEFIWEAASDICVLGAIGISTLDVALLGDSVMRAGYFVFDQDNGAIHMAQYANCGENEQAIPSDGKATDFSGDCTEEDAEDIINGDTSSGSGSGSGSGSNSDSDSQDDESGIGALTGNTGAAFILAAAVAFSLL
ncbi:acid protease [Zalerion maritima]|uniref:Acid protease n=1 Tax=Zalerion maritima TaxID=339359 RepID=A0AAD5RXP8_9PEZI|nr:acid protease [Zalerion maritima]